MTKPRGRGGSQEVYPARRMSADGREVLAEVAADPALNTIPVAVLTTSAYEGDVCGPYPTGRCLYLAKNPDFRHLREIVERIAAHAGSAPP